MKEARMSKEGSISKLFKSLLFSLSRTLSSKYLFVILFVSDCFIQSSLAQDDTFQLSSDDPNVVRNSTEILESRGFLTEIHHPITEDGYILTLIRIINPYIRQQQHERANINYHYPYPSEEDGHTHKNHSEPNWNGNWDTNNDNTISGDTLRPVLMQHGLVCNSDFWLLSRPTQLLPTGEYINENGTVTDCSGQLRDSVGTSLAMVLAACGYDVWLGNYRGNRYSYEHVLLNPRIDNKYWAFSIDELARYDLPAEILYILTKTNQAQLSYIGHSMGTTGMFQLLSERPSFSEYVYPFVALAPVTRVGKIETPVFQLGAHDPEIYEYITTAEAPLFGVPSPDWGIDITQVGRYFCGNSFLMPLCSLGVFVINGFDVNNTDERLIPQVAGHVPDETSARVVGHFAQRVVRSDFRQFDHGPKMNRKLYGFEVPPSYNLSAIQNRAIIMISSTGDWLADPGDVDYLRSQLTVPLLLDHVVGLQEFNHFDFSVGKDVGYEVNSVVLQSFRRLFG